MKIIFEPLPRESLYRWIWRKLLHNSRTAENVIVGLNGKVYIIKRGVFVDVPDWVPEIASHAPKHMRYTCYVPYQSVDFQDSTFGSN